jgi:simple sugar transport system ATP-binding protein
MSEVFLEARHISKSFVGVKALDDVDLTIGRGEIHCLIGENGSGKSTLIKIIGGVHKADSGTITVEGKQLSGSQAIESIRSGVQIIYQDLSLFPNLTVAENISVNQMLESNQQTVQWKEVRETARKALEEIGEAHISLDERVENLSMAKKQIIAISRALTQNAKLIIMDEATSAITKEEVDHLFSIIQNLKKKGIATLFVSHKLSEVFEISENITIIRDGKKVGVYPTSELDHDKLVYIMTGRKLEAEPYVYNAKMKQASPLLEVKSFSKELQYQDISFSLQPGEILGITGLIGSGRTEIVQSIFGLNPADSGTMYMNGEEVRISNPRDAIRHGIALLPEDRLNQGLFDAQSIGDNIVITILKNFLKRIGLLDTARKRRSANEWIERLKIKTPDGNLPVNSLSGGNQQRVVLAKWLAINPKVFILDGPTIGIDIGSKHTIHDIIRDLAREGMGIIMISDEIQEVLDNCNRILLMSKGRIIKEIDDARTTTSEELYEIVTGAASAGVEA